MRHEEDVGVRYEEDVRTFPSFPRKMARDEMAMTEPTFFARSFAIRSRLLSSMGTERTAGGRLFTVMGNERFSASMTYIW